MTDEGLVSFECKVIGYPTPQLSWFKDGKQLQPGDVYELTGSKSLGKTRHRFIGLNRAKYQYNVHSLL
jgi:hypothetical protein